MGQRTYPQLPNGKILLSWIELLDKYNIDHTEGTSAHVEWKNEAKSNKKLPKIKVLIKNDEGNFEEYFEDNNYKDSEYKENENNGSLRITKRHKDFVWKRDIGNSKSGNCYVCRCVITDNDSAISHVTAKSKGGSNHVSNLRVTCKPCNDAMGTQNLEEFKKDFETSQSNHTRKVIIKRNSEIITKTDIINILEKYKLNNHDSKYFEKAIELLKEC